MFKNILTIPKKKYYLEQMLYLLRIDEDYKLFVFPSDTHVEEYNVEKYVDIIYNKNDYDAELTKIGQCQLNLSKFEFIDQYGFIDLEESEDVIF